MNFKEDRREGFIKWFRWSLEKEDCDPSLYMLNYLFNRFEHNLEQKLWICWIFGTTYYAPTAWVIWNEFPDFELVDQKRLEDWNTGNFHRLRYQTDTRYNKGHLPKQFSSYKEWVGPVSQRERFRSLLKEDPSESFWIVWEEIKTHLHKFGRYSTWFYLQTLRKCAGINLEAPHLMLSDYGGSKSHRNGLCMALGKDEWYGEKLSADQIKYLDEGARDILSEVKSRYASLDAEYFGMESCLCSYKKAFREKDGRYLGYYLDRQAEEISRVEADGWQGIDWRPFWEGRSETLDRNLHTSKTIRESLMIDGQFRNLTADPEEDSSPTDTLSMFGSL